MPSFVSLSNSVLYAVCIAIGTDLGGCCTGLYCSFSLIWYGPPGRVPTPLKMSLYSFRMYSLVMGYLCVLPLSCMESVFHFMCGSTGSVVCCACFALVTSVGVVLCSETWGWSAVFVVFDVGVLYVHKFLEVCWNVVKACGHQICGNWTYPIAFAWILPSISGPVVLVTSKMVGNTLLSICRCRTHDPRLCTDCPPYALMCTLGLSSWPSHSWPSNCWALWAGRMLQPAPVSTSQSVWKTWDPLDCDTHRGLMCSVSLSWIW